MRRTRSGLILLSSTLLATTGLAQSVCTSRSELYPAELPSERFGVRLDLDGSRLVISEGGSLNDPEYFVFESGARGWQEVARIPAFSPSVGASDLSLDGDTFAVGAGNWNGAVGAVFMYREANGTWSLEDTFGTSDGGDGVDSFGASVSLDGDRVLVGASSTDIPNGTLSGSAHVFERVGSTWSETAELNASDGSSQDNFGSEVALDGTTALVGSIREDILGFNNAGAVYVFEFDGVGWNETDKLVAPDPGSNQIFGATIELEGDLALIGAPGYSVDDDPGALYVWRRQGGSFQLEQRIEDLSYEGFGHNIALAGDRFVVAGWSTFGGPYQLFRRSNGVWSSELSFGEFAGFTGGFKSNAVFGGGQVFIGDYQDDTAGPNVGRILVYDLIDAPSSYCTAKTTSIGCLPVMTAVGAPSASGAGSFTLDAQEVPNQKPGLLFYGTAGPSALPFLGGILCVNPPLARTAVQSSLGNPPPSDCSGSYSLEFGPIAVASPVLLSGTDVHAQYWFRDPSHPDGTGVGLTDAQAFTLCD